MMKTHNLNIFGKDYKITSQYDETYVKEMAGFLTTTMEKVSDTTGVFDFYRLLVLSSLHLVDDYLKLLQECKQTSDPKIIKKIESMIGRVDSSLTEKRVL